MTFQEFKKRAFAIGKRYMNLKRDIDNKNLIYDSIVGSIEFKGTNLWILVFATFVASLGLNMNSVAVIIGAMLISPLMGMCSSYNLLFPPKIAAMLTRSADFSLWLLLAVGAVYSWAYATLVLCWSGIELIQQIGRASCRERVWQYV